MSHRNYAHLLCLVKHPGQIFDYELTKGHGLLPSLDEVQYGIPQNKVPEPPYYCYRAQGVHFACIHRSQKETNSSLLQRK